MIVDPRPQSTVEPWMIKYMGPTVPTGDEQKSSGFGTGSIIGGTLIGGGLIGGGIMAAKYFKNRATDKAGSPRLLGTGTDFSRRPYNTASAGAITKYSEGSGQKSAVKKAGGKLAGRLFMGAMMLEPMLTEEGDYNKVKQTTTGLIGLGGFELGMKAGKARFAKAAISGSRLLRVGGGLGKLAMGFTGMAALEFAAEEAIGAWQGGVEKERDLRKLNWVGNTDAFNTQRAHTMRQTSLQAMNSGMMSARSMLGREGVMLHQ